MKREREREREREKERKERERDDGKTIMILLYVRVNIANEGPLLKLGLMSSSREGSLWIQLSYFLQEIASYNQSYRDTVIYQCNQLICMIDDTPPPKKNKTKKPQNLTHTCNLY